MKKVVIILLAVALIGMFFTGCTSNTQPKPAPKENQTQEQSQPKTKVYSIGQTIQLGDYYLTVEKFNTNPKYEDPFNDLKEGQKVVAVDVTVENKGKEPKPYNLFDFTIQDKDGYTYEPSWNFTIKPSLSSGDLQPGRKVRGYITFEIPENDSGLELIYQPDWLDSGQVIVKLTD
jgi:hypothetical protein